MAIGMIYNPLLYNHSIIQSIDIQLIAVRSAIVVRSIDIYAICNRSYYNVYANILWSKYDRSTNDHITIYVPSIGIQSIAVQLAIVVWSIDICTICNWLYYNLHAMLLWLKYDWSSDKCCLKNVVIHIYTSNIIILLNNTTKLSYPCGFYLPRL